MLVIIIIIVIKGIRAPTDVLLQKSYSVYIKCYVLRITVLL
jgi:hypothetical protein